MKLEIKHISPYLEHGLKVIVTSPLHKEIDYLETISYLPDNLITLQENGDWYFKTEYNDFNVKPILKPLSDLTFEDVDVLKDKYDISEGSTMFRDKDISINPMEWIYDDIQYLFSRHFDVFGLIEKGLAIDINTLKQ
jgi:hypothetical protein